MARSTSGPITNPGTGGVAVYRRVVVAGEVRLCLAVVYRVPQATYLAFTGASATAVGADEAADGVIRWQLFPLASVSVVYNSITLVTRCRRRDVVALERGGPRPVDVHHRPIIVSSAISLVYLYLVTVVNSGPQGGDACRLEPTVIA